MVPASIGPIAGEDPRVPAGAAAVAIAAPAVTIVPGATAWVAAMAIAYAIPTPAFTCIVAAATCV